MRSAVLATKAKANELCQSAKAAALPGQDEASGFQSCLQDEKTARDELRQKWDRFSANERETCAEPPGVTFSYVELLTCLEMQSGSVGDKPQSQSSHRLIRQLRSHKPHGTRAERAAAIPLFGDRAYLPAFWQAPLLPLFLCWIHRSVAASRADRGCAPPQSFDASGRRGGWHHCAKTCILSPVA
jgi:hypothetical protein